MTIGNEPVHSAGADVLPTQLCNRCRKSFARDGAEVHAVVASWWLCPPCREKLIGGTGRGRQS